MSIASRCTLVKHVELGMLSSLSCGDHGGVCQGRPCELRPPVAYGEQRPPASSCGTRFVSKK